MKKRVDSTYVMCIFNEPNPVSLELRRVYRTLPDEKAHRLGMIRVIDEEDEDYLYPEEWFVPVRLPERGVEAFISPRGRLAAPARPRRGVRRTRG